MSAKRTFKTLTSCLFSVQRVYHSKDRITSLLYAGLSSTSCKLQINLHNEPDNLYKKLRIGIQGAPLDRGQPKPGVERGPQVVRDSGLVDLLKEIGHDVFDYGDVPLGLSPRKKNQLDESNVSEFSHLRNLKTVAESNHLISNSTSKILKDNRICLTIGGDHSIAIGTINGVSQSYNDLAVLWIDAHSDINTVSTTNSGNMHGMSLAFLIKELQPKMKKIPEFAWVTPNILSSNLAYIGLRSVDPAEKFILNSLGVTAYNMGDVDRFGILETIRLALDKICPDFKRPLHVSFDIDALDDLEVSNTGTPVSGGLTMREGMVILNEVYRAGNMVSMDLVEINPELGTQDAERRTGAIAKHLIANAFGYNNSPILKQQQTRPLRQ